MEEATVSTIKNFLSVITDMDVGLGTMLEVPRYAFDHTRDQYMVQTILDNLSYKHSGGDFVIGLTDVDLFKKGYNFVYGGSHLLHGVSIISILRLKDEDQQVFRKRVVTEAVHEIGHLLGLLHCRDETCVMFDPQSMADIDSKSYEFCDKCKKSLDRGSFREM